jgi:ribose 5-phosphate isomerase A
VEGTGIEEEKRAAAEAAAELVEAGMAVGLGTGSTVAHLLPALATRGLAGLRCVSTSPATERAARDLGLAVEEFDGLTRLDIAIDGSTRIRGSRHTGSFQRSLSARC